MTENQTSKLIPDAALEVHREPGGLRLLEDIDLNAKTQRRRDATDSWGAARKQWWREGAEPPSR